MFTDSYRSDINDYDFCGNDFDIELREQQEEQEFLLMEEWICSLEGPS